MSDARAWVGCLACYNEGRLTGEWVDGIEAGDYVPCHRPMHEEWWVMDFEGYDGLLTAECSPMEAQRLAELADEIEATGLPVEAYAAYVNNYDPGETGSVTAEQARDAFQGEYESTRDFVMEYAEELSPKIFEQSWPLNCIDWDLAERDLEGFFFAKKHDGTVYVFQDM